nr:DNA recombination protein RmuC [Sphingomonas quercus]
MLAGLGAGWLLGRQGLAAARGERDEVRRDFNRAITELAAAATEAKQVEPLKAERAAAEARAVAAETALGAARAQAEERAAAHAAQIAQLNEAREALAAQFGEVGTKLLAEAQRNFLERADQRFAEAGKDSETKLKALLSPVQDTLKRYEEGLSRVEKERVDSYAELRQTVTQLAQGNDVVRRETARLANVLRSSPKHRGRWGEEQLRTVLESAGLSENVDFSLQGAVNDGERLLRPDCVIHLPGGRCIVIDVKCPLVAFEQAFDEEDEERRAALLLAHANAMRSYAADLGRKGYWRQFELSPDFVIMFIPGEHFLAAAAERAPDLIETAFRSGVIIASTINMLALAKVMAGMWRQEKLAEQAEAIGALGKELYARLAVMGDHVAKLGRNLNQATGAYNAFVSSLDRNVLTSARRFEALKVDTSGKAIEPVSLIDATAIGSTKLSALADGTAEAAE